MSRTSRTIIILLSIMAIAALGTFTVSADELNLIQTRSRLQAQDQTPDAECNCDAEPLNTNRGLHAGTDADNDGLCDGTGEAFVDVDGDSICDNAKSMGAMQGTVQQSCAKEDNAAGRAREGTAQGLRQAGQASGETRLNRGTCSDLSLS